MPTDPRVSSAVPAYDRPDRELFETVIRPARRPALLRGAIGDWPSVAKGMRSDEALCDYLLGHDSGEPAGVYVAPPQARGSFFYGFDTHLTNFSHGPATLPEVIERLLAERGKTEPMAISLQSTPIARQMPGFGGENRLDLLPDVAPRIWVGNAVVTRTHYDLNDNIACVVAGRRRFSLFPPEQLPNLYPGPYERTIGGVPVSMVDIDKPDLDRYPHFAEAQAARIDVELEPGDAIYIPYGWWHQVRSLSPFNVLVNYWWDAAAQADTPPSDAFLHAILAIRDLPEHERAVWRNLFAHYVFGENGDPVAHLSPRDKGLYGPLDAATRRRLKRQILKALEG
ncbi:cupin-like domain-containing protein [Asticcacaulis sp. AND118]|uniref:cupin-like domain-containing protein n=1 Tax=Asticcacaulis sp. AND118 TaxID=2840468 RepID=UPI001CFFB7E9|nr:cupin-like domain-containing protein [Asticcacaulis sp. AND118]UDF05537.1 cupin-like domain-containing protein [Asticcacaulis sp. AND118]